ncbi:unnamed protein product [marine sediment metagenome]|uniref:Uncharacterized protein n=1 Tax=marine sediment metagenome TaxID=412755 RepID=X1D749_9ZZZZ
MELEIHKLSGKYDCLSQVLCKIKRNTVVNSKNTLIINNLILRSSGTPSNKFFSFTTKNISGTIKKIVT